MKFYKGSKFILFVIEEAMQSLKIVALLFIAVSRGCVKFTPKISYRGLKGGIRIFGLSGVRALPWGIAAGT